MQRVSRALRRGSRIVLILRTLPLGLGLLLIGQPALAEQQAPRDPNEKVCQTITPVGSRLGGKKVCATRAEWDEQRRQDREVIEKAQTQVCVINPATGKCGGQ